MSFACKRCIPPRAKSERLTACDCLQPCASPDCRPERGEAVEHLPAPIGGRTLTASLRKLR